MNINEALDRIDAEWIRKPIGFRVKYDFCENGRWQTEYSPEESAPPLKSEVTAWRLAWKLAQTCQSDPVLCKDGDLANIFVVDDQGTRIPTYITGNYDVYHPIKTLKSPKRIE